MTTVQDLIDRLESVELDVIIGQSLEDTAPELAELNVEQLYSGKLNNDDPITPSYAPSTVRRKKKKGQPYDRVTTRDEGNYHKNMRASVGVDTVYIHSDVDHEYYLQKRYGEKLYGLTPQNNETYAKGPFFQAFKEKFEAKTLLSFTD